MNPRAEALKKRTFQFGLQIIRFCRALRRTWEGRELSDQLFRASTRVGANYRAACRGRSHADFVAKLGLAVEEADEAIYWLELISAAGIAAGSEFQSLLDEANELSRIFNQSQLTASRNAAARRTTDRDRADPQCRKDDRHGHDPQVRSPYIRKFVNPSIRQ